MGRVAGLFSKLCISLVETFYGLSFSLGPFFPKPVHTENTTQSCMFFVFLDNSIGEWT